MSRYINLFSLPRNQYTRGCPVLIAAGSLLKDTQTGNILTQLKFMSLSGSAISGLIVSVDAYDLGGQRLEGVCSYSYLDLFVHRNMEFGQKQAIIMPDATTRRVTIRCTKVFFHDGSTWEPKPNAKWIELRNPEPLEKALGAVLIDFYRRETTQKAKVAPTSQSDLWICTCGNINIHGETSCHACGINLEKLKSVTNIDYLNQLREAFLKEEEKKAEAARRKTRIKRRILAVLSFLAIFSVSAHYFFSSVLPPLRGYKYAESLLSSGDYDGAISAFTELGNYKDSSERISAIYYAKGEAFLASGDFDDAISSFEHAGDYKDASSRILTIIGLEYLDTFRTAKAGDTVFLGQYEQDNNKNNGKEIIEWNVLFRDSDRILITSKFALDCQPYHDSWVDVTWADCSLRSWLNDYFFYEAFSTSEQGYITSVTTKTSTNSSSVNDGAQETTDKIFLMDVGQAGHYGGRVEATAFAKAQGAFVSGNGFTWWWLRTHGDEPDSAVMVFDDGFVFRPGAIVIDTSNAVRPTMWIDTSLIN